MVDVEVRKQPRVGCCSLYYWSVHLRNTTSGCCECTIPHATIAASYKIWWPRQTPRCLVHHSRRYHKTGDKPSNDKAHSLVDIEDSSGTSLKRYIQFVQWEPSCTMLSHAERRTDITTLIVAFHNIAKAPKNERPPCMYVCMCMYIYIYIYIYI